MNTILIAELKGNATNYDVLSFHIRLYACICMYVCMYVCTLCSTSKCTGSGAQLYFQIRQQRGGRRFCPTLFDSQAVQSTSSSYIQWHAKLGRHKLLLLLELELCFCKALYIMHASYMYIATARLPALNVCPSIM